MTLTGTNRLRWEAVYCTLRDLGFSHERARDLAWEVIGKEAAS